MDTQRIIFVGSQNLGGLLDDGETMKNYMLAKGLERCGCQLCRIDMRHRPQRFYYLVKYLYNIIFRKKSKIVMSSSPLVADKLFRLAKMFGWKGEDMYYWVIGGTFGNLCIENKINKNIYLDIRKIIVEGQSMQTQLESEGFQNVMVLPNMKEINYIPQKSFNEGHDKRFVFLSRVMREKGVDYIIEASKMLIESGVDSFSVDIYGRLDSKYKEILVQKLKSISNVQYKGFLMLDEKRGYDILSTYDAMLFPTYWHGEGFPGILIDAFIAGIPVIASDWNLNKYLIEDGVNGIIIPPHDSKALYGTMKSVIANEVNLKTMSENAQNSCLKFELKNVINLDLLKKINLL